MSDNFIDPIVDRVYEYTGIPKSILLHSTLPTVHLWDCRSLEMNGGGSCDCKLRGEIHSHRLIELLWND